MKVIAFTKVKLPYGWLSNMAPFPITYNNLVWRTSEALFQASRFAFTFANLDIIEKIRLEPSPMAAKMIAKKHADQMVVEQLSQLDVDNMRSILKLKLEQHPDLWKELLSTKGSEIIEDCTKRQHGSGLFWGAALQDLGQFAGGDQWIGENKLGKLWMEIRDENF